MKVTIIGRQLNVWDEMKATIEKKLEKFDNFLEMIAPQPQRSASSIHKNALS